jgi:hypothetical protein
LQGVKDVIQALVCRVSLPPRSFCAPKLVWMAAFAAMTTVRGLLAVLVLGGSADNEIASRFVEKIRPLRIHLLDQADLPGAFPLLDLAFSADSGVHTGA